MPRRPIQLEQAKLKSPRQRMWLGILSLHKVFPAGFTCLQVEDKAHPISLNTVRTYLSLLVKHGYVVEVTNLKPHISWRGSKYYSVIKVQPNLPRLSAANVQQGICNLAMWQMAKILKIFTATELCTTASQGSVIIAKDTVKKYCQALAATGFFRVIKCGLRNQFTYKLVRNTGPKAPAITREKKVFDPNTGKLYELNKEQAHE